MQTFFLRLFQTVLRLLIVGLGVLFTLVLLAAGVVFMLGLAVWSLVRGRKPSIAGFRVPPRPGWTDMPRGFRAQRPPRSPRRQEDVLDVEVREVPEAQPSLNRD